MGFHNKCSILFSLTLVLFLLAKGVHAQSAEQICISVDKLLKSGETSQGKIKINSLSLRADTTRINHFLSLAKKVQIINYDSLQFYSRQALELSMKLGDLNCISQSLQVLGKYYMTKEEYRLAGEYFVICIRIEEKLGHGRRIAILNEGLGTVYYYQEVFEKSRIYFMTALAFFRANLDTLQIAEVYKHLGSLYNSREYCEPRTKEQKKEDYNAAIDYLQKSIQLCIETGNKPLMIDAYVSTASAYNKLEQAPKAMPYLKQAIGYYRATNNLNKLAGTLHTLGLTYCKTKQYGQSIQCYQEALKISLENKYTDGIQYLYESMAQTYDDSKDYKNARDYYIKYMIIKDSIKSLEKSKELFEVETKYQSEKKEKEILKLTAEKHEKNILLLTLSGLLVILFILGYSIVRNIRNKKIIAEQTIEIKEQHILELEKERQLIATKSVLSGEESERSRMARDLHDGLGGLLSGVKINLSSMKGNSIITSDNAEAFDHAIRLLDTSISELRRVAHNLMPETLNHYGLKTALNDFITEMSTNQTPVLTFRFFGEDVRYSTQLELTIYRITQELFNNALKHAGAANIDLQLILEADRVCVQVVDNGKGFDISGKKGDGKGLVSIRERVEAHGGNFDLESKAGEGTEASIEFLLS